MHLIPCTCDEYTSMIDKPWIFCLSHQQQPRYEPVTYCTYLPALGSSNNWNIIKFSQKATTSEDYEHINQVLIYGISDNMASMVQYGKYGSKNKTYTSTMGCYVIKFLSEAYNLQYATICHGQKSSAGELVVNS